MDIWDKEDYQNQWNKAWGFDDEKEFADWKKVMDAKYSYGKWTKSFMERYANSLTNLYDMRKYFFLKQDWYKSQIRIAASEQAKLYEVYESRLFFKKKLKLEYEKKKEETQLLIVKEMFYKDCNYILERMIRKSPEQNFERQEAFHLGSSTANYTRDMV